MKRSPHPSKYAAVYLRVSTDDQKHDSQRDRIEDWCAREGIDVETLEWFEDTESGRRMDRKHFDRLRAEVIAGRCRTIIVYKLDRISRDLLDGMDVLRQWLKAGARVVSVTEQIDLSGPVGQIIAAVLLGLAEIEWGYRKERQADGIKVAKANGVYKGREKGSTKGDPRRARELRELGLGASEIATAMGVTRETVYNYLRTAKSAHGDNPPTPDQ
jgi:DNA invertase Pin-like site-specific DNA recombinase